jgi:hypothetical protein
MPGPVVRKAIESFVAEIAQLPDGTYYVALTATTVDDEERNFLAWKLRPAAACRSTRCLR